MTNPDRLLLRQVEVAGDVVDVAVAAGRIETIGPDLPTTADVDVIEGGGGALIPGLHDHHVHLFATAATAASVATGPTDVRDRSGLADALRGADAERAPGTWLRAVGYHESVAGDLDRDALDAIVAERPTRIQHRSGARWTLNSAAIDALGIEALTWPGIERDGDGRVTGRLHRADDWLRDLLAEDSPPDLAPIGQQLARCGVTGVTDTTPTARTEDLESIGEAIESGALPQRVMVTGAPQLAGTPMPPTLETGPVKIVIDDDTYPALDELVEQLQLAHDHGRPVAIHCVSRASIVLALAAWDVAGSRPGDRVEHGSVIPPEMDAVLVRLGLTVVTQPGFVAERGDQYLHEVDPDDLPHLYRCASLLDAGIRVAGSTDAPYTTLDPWSAMRAAVHRTTPTGVTLSAGETISPVRALQLFLGDLGDPGGESRSVQVGAPADLCLLAHPLAAILERLTAEDVMATIRSGRVVHAVPAPLG